MEDDDPVIEALVQAINKRRGLQLVTVVCVQADPLLVSINGVGSVPAVQQGTALVEGDVAYALWAPPRMPVVFGGSGGGGGTQGLFGTGVDQSGTNANAGGNGASATGENSLAVGDVPIASGYASSALGSGPVASGFNAHAQGSSTASGDYAHAQNDSNLSSGVATHTEGQLNAATADTAHAEGYRTIAGGYFSHTQGIGAHAFRRAEDATAAYGFVDDPRTLQRSQACLVHNGTSPNEWDAGDGVDPIVIPVHDGRFDAKLTIYSDDMADRWDITFRGDNDAGDFAGRAAGTVTIAASAGGSATVYGASGITWTVTGTSTGDVEITPSATISNRYAHIDLFELHANV